MRNPLASPSITEENGVVVYEHTEVSLRARAEQLAKEVLNVSLDKAFEMIKSGELDGTLVKDELNSIRFLLQQEKL